MPKKVKSTMSRYFIKSFMQHGRRLLEDAGLGLFVPSGAERAYFRLPCTLHSSVPLLYKAAELVCTAVHIEIWVYINELFIPFFDFRLAYEVMKIPKYYKIVYLLFIIFIIF